MSGLNTISWENSWQVRTFSGAHLLCTSQWFLEKIMYKSTSRPESTTRKTTVWPVWRDLLLCSLMNTRSGVFHRVRRHIRHIWLSHASSILNTEPVLFHPDPARVINMPPVIYVPRKLPGIIRCPVDANPPVISVKWEKDGYPLRVEKVRLPQGFGFLEYFYI